MNNTDNLLFGIYTALIISMVALTLTISTASASPNIMDEVSNAFVGQLEAAPPSSSQWKSRYNTYNSNSSADWKSTNRQVDQYYKRPLSNFHLKSNVNNAYRNFNYREQQRLNRLYR